MNNWLALNSRIFDWIQSFNYWLDDTLPWRLRHRISALKKENDSLCKQLTEKIYAYEDLKRMFLELRHKMNLPFRASIIKPHFDILDDSPISVKTLRLTFDRFYVRMMVSEYAIPRYSEQLLNSVAEETAERMVKDVQDHIYKVVKDFYRKEFLE